MKRIKIVMQRLVLEVDVQTELGEKVCADGRFLHISDEEDKGEFTAKSKV